MGDGRYRGRREGVREGGRGGGGETRAIYWSCYVVVFLKYIELGIHLDTDPFLQLLAVQL